MVNRIARSIVPEADAESDDFRDGVVAGYHDFIEHANKRLVLNQEDAAHWASTCANKDWCAGWLAGYEVGRYRYEHPKASNEQTQEEDTDKKAP